MSTDRAAATANHSADFVQSLERGLAVIKAFDAEDRELTLSDVARKTGLTRAAARRFLHTLVTLGYVRSDKRMFSLRPRVLELGYAYLSGLSLPEVAQPHLEELTAAVHESTSISVLDGDMVVYVARVAAKRIMAVGITVGTRFPAHATSMGRVLLAYAPKPWLDDYLANVDLQPSTRRTITSPERLTEVLAQVRREDYALVATFTEVLAQVRREDCALVDQELEEGLRSIAVPLRDLQGAVIAAVNVSTHVSRSDITTLRAELLPPLRRTVAAIEADLPRVAASPKLRSGRAKPLLTRGFAVFGCSGSGPGRGEWGGAPGVRTPGVGWVWVRRAGRSRTRRGRRPVGGCGSGWRGGPAGW